MKCNTDEWRILMKTLNQNITHADRQLLPLVSVELTPSEWVDFVIARTTLENGTRVNAREFDGGEAVYRGIKIFRGAPE